MGNTHLNRRKTEKENSYRFPKQQSEKDARSHCWYRELEQVPCKGNPCIGQCKHRHYEICNPRMQTSLKLVHQRIYILHIPAYLMYDMLLLRICQHLYLTVAHTLELLKPILQAHTEPHLIYYGFGRYCKSQQHTRNCCVYSRHKYKIPQEETRHNIQKRIVHLASVESEQKQHYYCRINQHVKMKCVCRIEHRQNYNRPQIIHNCQGCKEDLETQRNPLAKERKHTQCKSDVGCHRYSPSLRTLSILEIEYDIDDCRNNHSTHSGKYREGSLPY